LPGLDVLSAGVVWAADYFRVADKGGSSGGVSLFLNAASGQRRTMYHASASKLFTLLVIAGLFVGRGASLAVAASEIPESVETSGARFLTPDTLARIDQSLKWLSVRQTEDGAFGVRRGYGRNVAVVSLAGLAWLSSGSSPGRGPYGVNIQRATDFVLNSCRSSGYINVPEGQSHGPMYGHGFATLYLLIISCQNKEGGWRYENEPNEADVSVTVCQIMALRAARNCGLFVPKDVVDRCIDYAKQCQNDDGGFRYQLVRRSSSQFARSAAGLVALYSAGVYDGPEIGRALNYLERHRPAGIIDPHYYYGHYYAVQAQYQAGGDHWNRWFPRIRDQLLNDQQKDGSWSDLTFSNEYATAMSCIILQIPNNHLPIFKR
jgi:hypothetical protein